MGRIKRLGLTALVAVLMVAAAIPIAEGRSTTRTSGNGWHIDVSWQENDPDDLLGLPGNVHLGFMFAQSDQYGQYFFGAITDWDCEPGETPGGHGFAVNVVNDTTKAAKQAAADTVDRIVDSGASRIDAAAVISAVRSELAATLADAFEEEFPPTCDFVQERSLDGSQANVSIDGAKGVAKITGTLTVTGGHGGGGPVLGRPPINVTVSGGSWEKFDWANKYWGEGYSYSDNRAGTNWYGGVVSGAIGAMGFDDDPDDSSFASFGAFTFKTVDRIR